MAEQPTLNAAQMQAVQTHLQKLLQDVNLRKWAIDVVLTHAGQRDIKDIITLSDQVYGFVAKPVEPTAEKAS
jgi:hypothetical protein